MVIPERPSPSAWLSGLDPTEDAVETVTQGQLPDRCDVAIVGAGMTGASLAYHLSNGGSSGSNGGNGLSVVVLDARCVSGGASGRNGGILWPDSDEPFELKTAAELRAFVAATASKEGTAPEEL